MKNKAVLLLLFSVLFLGNQVNGFANHGKDNAYCMESKFYSKFDFMMEHRNDLELTDDQMNGIKNIKYTVDKSKAEADAAAKIAVLDIYHEIYQGEGNIEALNGLVDEKLESQKKLGYALVKGLLDFKNVLSSSQYKKMKDLWYEQKYSEQEHGSSCCGGGAGHGDGRCHKG